MTPFKFDNKLWKVERMTRDEILKTLQQLSKRTGFSIMEIAYMARIIAQADYDPLPPEEVGRAVRISPTQDQRYWR